MRRALLIVALAAGCGNDGRQVVDAKKPDAPADAHPDAAGSGSNVAVMETTPHDYGLELMVVVTSMVIVVGPIRSTRRRRGPIDDAGPTT